MVLICLALLGSLTAFDGVEESHLLKLWQERQKITSGEFTIRTHFILNKTVPLFEGADWDFHLWWTSDLSVFRLDRHRVEMKRTEDTDHRDNIAFDGDTYRIVYRKDTPNHNIGEYRSRKPSGKQLELYDPRLFGLYPELIEAFHNATPDDLARIVSKAESVERGDEPGGTFEIYKHAKKITYSYHYDESGRPIRVEAEDGATPQLRYDLRMSYDRADGGKATFPAKIEMKSFHDGDLAAHEVIELHASSLNIPVDRSICTWAALQPPPGATLIVNDEDYDKASQFWDGKNMQPIPAGSRVQDLSTATRTNQNLKIFIALNIAVICAVLIVYRLFRRRGMASGDASTDSSH